MQNKGKKRRKIPNRIHKGYSFAKKLNESKSAKLV